MLPPDVRDWGRFFGIEDDIMRKLASDGFNTLAVIGLIEPADLESVGIAGVGFRKKVLHAVDQLKRELWRPKAANDDGDALKTHQIRCSNCHRYRTKGSKHTCTEAEKCTNLMSCPTQFVTGHSEALKKKRKEQREQQRKQKNEETEQHKRQKQQTAQQFLEEELKRTLDATSVAPAAAATPTNGAVSVKTEAGSHDNDSSDESSEAWDAQPSAPPSIGPSSAAGEPPPTPYHIVIRGESLGIVLLKPQTSLADARSLISKALKLDAEAWDYDEPHHGSVVAGAYPLYKTPWGSSVPAIMIHE